MIVSMEGQYEKLKERNAELDMQLLDDAKEIESFNKLRDKMERVISFQKQIRKIAN